MTLPSSEDAVWERQRAVRPCARRVRQQEAVQASGGNSLKHSFSFGQAPRQPPGDCRPYRLAFASRPAAGPRAGGTPPTARLLLSPSGGIWVSGRNFSWGKRKEKRQPDPACAARFRPRPAIPTAGRAAGEPSGRGPGCPDPRVSGSFFPEIPWPSTICWSQAVGAAGDPGALRPGPLLPAPHLAWCAHPLAPLAPKNLGHSGTSSIQLYFV